MSNKKIELNDAIPALKQKVGYILGRRGNHDVQFEKNGFLYEIRAKNNRDYELVKLCYTNEKYVKQIAIDQNPFNLIEKIA